MLVNVLSYEVNLPNGKVFHANGYNDIVSVINDYNNLEKIVPGKITFPSMFDFIGFLMNTESKVELVVNNVVLGTISKVIQEEEIECYLPKDL